MLVGVSTMFIVLTTPMGVYVVLGTIYGDVASTLDELLRWQYFKYISYLVYYLNSAINFWVYAAIGPRFRHELKLILRLAS